MAEFKADKENPEAAKAAENLSGKIRKTRRYRFEIAPNTETAIRQSYSWYFLITNDVNWCLKRFKEVKFDF